MIDEGNVHPEKTAAPAGEIRPGDVVCLTPEALRRAPRLMGPVKLYSIGWPNAFQVIHVFDVDGVSSLTIGGCCHNLLLNRRNGAWLCSGHDAKWFRKVSAEAEAPKEAPRERRKGDRVTSVEAPLVGEVGGLEFLDDEHNPRMIIRVLGQKIVLNGKAAVEISKLAQDNGLL